MVVVKEKVRKEIVQVARRIFNRQGYRKTTMEDISAATKMGKSSIYYYFQGKEDIFRAVVTHEAKEMKKRLTRTIGRYESPVEQLRAYMLFRVQTVRTLSNFYAALNEEALSHIDFVQRIRRGFEKEEHLMVSAILEEGMKKGCFQLSSADIGAVAISAMLKGLELPLILNEEYRQSRDKLMDEVIRVFLHGIISEPA